MRLTDLEIAHAMKVLGNLSISADSYIDDGSWIDNLTEDLQSARKVLRKYAKILEKERKEQENDLIVIEALFHKTLARGFSNGTLDGKQVGELIKMYRGFK
jgi:hypothetical protein